MLRLFPMPSLFSYVVARDYGFAPNPFHGYCTLATCKPDIRKAASLGDWIIGTGSKKNSLSRHMVYAMCVSEAMSFNDYWRDLRFLCKRPDMYSNVSRAFGDNIYHRGDSGNWDQLDSHHSYGDKTPNYANITRDTKTDRVLVSDDFIYWGGAGPKIPLFSGYDVCKNGQGHKRNFTADVIDELIGWIRSFDEVGYVGDPLDWHSL